MSMEKMRDSIDFKNTDIKTLFRKLLLPTVLGMIFSALFVITDGIFVGKELAVMLWRRSTLWHRYGCSLRVWDLCSESVPLWWPPFICHTGKSRWHVSTSHSL